MLIFEQCFYGLSINRSLSSRDYIFIKHANRVDSYRIFAKYKTVSSANNTFREDYGDLLGINLSDGKEWQWHHVVEGTHINQLYSESEAEDLYKRQIPTVLIHQTTEHIDYNLFHAHGVKTVFNLQRSNGVLSGPSRISYISKLINLYSIVYGHDGVLKTVALNILRSL